MNMLDLQTTINIILTSGIIGQFLFFKAKKRKSMSEANLSEVEVKVQEFDLERIRFEHVKKELADNYIQLDELQKIINELRNKLNSQSKEIFNLEQSLITANNFRCTREGCEDRVPPRTFRDDIIKMEK